MAIKRFGIQFFRHILICLQQTKTKFTSIHRLCLCTQKKKKNNGLCIQIY